MVPRYRDYWNELKKTKNLRKEQDWIDYLDIHRVNGEYDFSCLVEEAYTRKVKELMTTGFPRRFRRKVTVCLTLRFGPTS